jgi:hypothetical protein
MQFVEFHSRFICYIGGNTPAGGGSNNGNAGIGSGTPGAPSAPSGPGETGGNKFAGTESVSAAALANASNVRSADSSISQAWDMVEGGPKPTSLSQLQKDATWKDTENKHWQEHEQENWFLLNPNEYFNLWNFTHDAVFGKGSDWTPFGSLMMQNTPLGPVLNASREQLARSGDINPSWPDALKNQLAEESAKKAAYLVKTQANRKALMAQYNEFSKKPMEGPDGWTATERGIYVTLFGNMSIYGPDTDIWNFAMKDPDVAQRAQIYDDSGYEPNVAGMDQMGRWIMAPLRTTRARGGGDQRAGPGGSIEATGYTENTVEGPVEQGIGWGTRFVPLNSPFAPIYYKQDQLVHEPITENTLENGKPIIGADGEPQTHVVGYHYVPDAAKAVDFNGQKGQWVSVPNQTGPNGENNVQYNPTTEQPIGINPSLWPSGMTSPKTVNMSNFEVIDSPASTSGLGLYSYSPTAGPYVTTNNGLNIPIYNDTSMSWQSVWQNTPAFQQRVNNAMKYDAFLPADMQMKEDGSGGLRLTDAELNSPEVSLNLGFNPKTISAIIKQAQIDRKYAVDAAKAKQVILSDPATAGIYGKPQDAAMIVMNNVKDGKMSPQQFDSWASSFEMGKDGKVFNMPESVFYNIYMSEDKPEGLITFDQLLARDYITKPQYDGIRNKFEIESAIALQMDQWANPQKYTNKKTGKETLTDTQLAKITQENFAQGMWDKAFDVDMVLTRFPRDVAARIWLDLDMGALKAQHQPVENAFLYRTAPKEVQNMWQMEQTRAREMPQLQAQKNQLQALIDNSQFNEAVESGGYVPKAPMGISLMFAQDGPYANMSLSGLKTQLAKVDAQLQNHYNNMQTQEVSAAQRMLQSTDVNYGKTDFTQARGAVEVLSYVAQPWSPAGTVIGGALAIPKGAINLTFRAAINIGNKVDPFFFSSGDAMTKYASKRAMDWMAGYSNAKTSSFFTKQAAMARGEIGHLNNPKGSDPSVVVNALTNPTTVQRMGELQMYAARAETQAAKYGLLAQRDSALFAQARVLNQNINSLKTQIDVAVNNNQRQALQTQLDSVTNSLNTIESQIDNIVRTRLSAKPKEQAAFRKTMTGPDAYQKPYNVALTKIFPATFIDRLGMKMRTSKFTPINKLPDVIGPTFGEHMSILNRSPKAWINAGKLASDIQNLEADNMAAMAVNGMKTSQRTNNTSLLFTVGEDGVKRAVDVEGITPGITQVYQAMPIPKGMKTVPKGSPKTPRPSAVPPVNPQTVPGGKPGLNWTQQQAAKQTTAPVSGLPKHSSQQTHKEAPVDVFRPSETPISWKNSRGFVHSTNELEATIKMADEVGNDALSKSARQAHQELISNGKVSPNTEKTLSADRRHTVIHKDFRGKK